MKLFKEQKGFTIIELLVIIAIIGILASVVLVSLNVARVRSRNTSIRASMSQMRAQAQVYYEAQNPVSYDPGPAGGETVCADSTNTLDLDVLRGAAVAVGGTSFLCNPNTLVWAAQITLIGGAYYCVDSTGFSGDRTTSLLTGTICPAT